MIEIPLKKSHDSETSTYIIPIVVRIVSNALNASRLSMIFSFNLFTELTRLSYKTSGSVIGLTQ
jgi:hypothetical protein